MPTESFTISAEDAVRTFARYLPMGVIGAALGAFVSGFRFTTFVAGLVVAFGASYYAYRKSIAVQWISLSPEGITGRFLSGGEVHFGWNEILVMEPRRLGAFQGVALSRQLEKAPFIFVPALIARQDAFRACVSKLAAPNHPLRELVHVAT